MEDNAWCYVTSAMKSASPVLTIASASSRLVINPTAATGMLVAALIARANVLGGTDRNILLGREPTESRAAFRRIVDQGWTDAIRALHPNEPMYTFWHYLLKRWERDAGLRLDHLLVSPSLSKRLIASGIDRDVRGEFGASDHAPA
jgi:hypothetical protein